MAAVPGGGAPLTRVERRPTSPSGIDETMYRPSSAFKDKDHLDKPRKHQHHHHHHHRHRLLPNDSSHPQHRLNTADSARSILSTLTSATPPPPNSRPGTGASTKSTSSLRLLQRRRGRNLFADLHLLLDSVGESRRCCWCQQRCGSRR